MAQNPFLQYVEPAPAPEAVNPFLQYVTPQTPPLPGDWRVSQTPEGQYLATHPEGSRTRVWRDGEWRWPGE